MQVDRNTVSFRRRCGIGLVYICINPVIGVLKPLNIIKREKIVTTGGSAAICVFCGIAAEYPGIRVKNCSVCSKPGVGKKCLSILYMIKYNNGITAVIFKLNGYRNIKK